MIELEKHEGVDVKPIKGYEGLYWISSDGRVLTSRGKGYKDPQISLLHWMVNNKGTKGYLILCLSRGNKSKSFKIHRLVAQHFIEDKNNRNHVNHKDGNVTNNNVTNLEWVTNQENSFYQKKNKSYKTFKGVFNTGKKFIARIRHNNKLMNLGTFKSDKEAAIAYNEAASQLFGRFALLNAVQVG